MTLGTLLDRWIQPKRDDPEVRPVTVAGYENVLLSVRARLGHRPVQSITTHDIEQLKSWLAAEGGQRHKGLSPRSVAYTLTALKAALGRAVAVERVLTANPFDGLSKSRKRSGHGTEVERWDTAELLAFRRTADLDPWGAAFRLSLAGLRRSEVMGMTWSSVDFEAGTVTVGGPEASRVVVGRTTVLDKPKSDASWRTIPVERIHPGTMAALRQLRMHSPLSADDDLILLDPAGRPVYPGAYSDRFQEVCAAAGVPKIHLHSLQHSLAYQLHEFRSRERGQPARPRRPDSPQRLRVRQDRRGPVGRRPARRVVRGWLTARLPGRHPAAGERVSARCWSTWPGHPL